MTLAVSQTQLMSGGGSTPIVLGYLERSPYSPLALVLPLLISGASWILGGVSWMTDLSFIFLTGICMIYLGAELLAFPRRFGIGGIVLYGGVLIWFSYDYLSHWLGHDPTSAYMAFGPDVIAKATFAHCLFVLMMSVGLLVRFHRPLTRLIHAVPEPNYPTFYLWMIIGLFLVGLIPYLLFTAEPFHVSIWRDMTAGRTAGGARWTVGRTGNVNYAWGAYAALLVQLGQIGGQLAVFYALLVARNPMSKLLAWSMWGFYLALAFGSGSRGQVVFMALPLIALMFLKYQSFAATVLGRWSQYLFRAYVFTTVVALGVLFIVQFQGIYRTIGFASEQAIAGDVSLLDIQGTSMFSEGMLGYALIPDEADFFYNSIPGEKLLRPIPQAIYWFLVGPIPRALWTTKPIDPAWEWYNTVYTGGRSTIAGTTISQGLVGYWYFRFGLAGVIQGGLLIGWLMSVAEKSLQHASGKPMRILMSLAFATWLFRIFRGVNFNSLYPILIGGALLYMVIHVYNAATVPPAPEQPRRN